MAPPTARAGPSTPSGKPSASHPKSTSGGPTRTPKHRSNSHAATTSSSSATAIPGVQKLKAALRQTRRLLAKEDLNADARVVAERKLKAQEAELAAAEIARTERTMATRYHKIKFFGALSILQLIYESSSNLIWFYRTAESCAEDNPNDSLARSRRPAEGQEEDLAEDVEGAPCRSQLYPGMSQHHLHCEFR
jgi:hypothetical protein